MDIIQAPPPSALPSGSIVLDSAVQTQFSSNTADDLNYKVSHVQLYSDLLSLNNMNIIDAFVIHSYKFNATSFLGPIYTNRNRRLQFCGDAICPFVWCKLDKE